VIGRNQGWTEATGAFVYARGRENTDFESCIDEETLTRIVVNRQTQIIAGPSGGGRLRRPLLSIVTD